MLMLLMFFFFLFFYSIFIYKWELVLSYLLFLNPLIYLMNMNSSFLSKNSLFSIDSYSLLMMFLSIWIVLLSLFSSYLILLSKMGKLYLLTFGFLVMFLMLSFFSNNLLMFFFFFESTLIPTLFIIIGWGYKVERLNSGLSMFFYTLMGSFPMLSIIFLMMSKNNLLFFEFLEMENFLFITYLFFILAFLIKMPMFFIHSWLPKAHVEAPVAGSMILAGVLLKLGGYGIFRMSMIYKYFLNYNLIWIYISIFGGVVSSLMCLRQKDIKALIAYSSVAHMSLVILGLLIYSDSSIWGSFLVMVAHGLCSSGMFFMSNMIYERSQSRSIFFNKSLLTLSPSLGLLWFLFCGANMSSPFSLNLVGEIFLIYSIMEWSYYLVFSLMTLCFLGGVYNLYLFSITSQGPITLITNCFFSVNMREFLICIMHLIPLNILFLKMELFY